MTRVERSVAEEPARSREKLQHGRDDVTRLDPGVGKQHVIEVSDRHI